MKKNDTLLLVLLGIVGAFILWMFSKRNIAPTNYGVVGASTVAENGSSSGILTPVTAINAVTGGISAIESALSNENNDTEFESPINEGNLSELDISDDTEFED